MWWEFGGVDAGVNLRFLARPVRNLAFSYGIPDCKISNGARLTKVDYPVCAFLPGLDIKGYFSAAGGIEAVLYQFAIAPEAGGCNGR